jgi:hypothetical protein
MTHPHYRVDSASRTSLGVRLIRLVSLVLLALLPLMRPGARPTEAAPAWQGADPKPANLLCPGPGVVPVPPPAPADWTPAYPIWEWRDLISFESLNEPGHNSPIAVAIAADCTIYVADHERAEVVQLTPDGAEQRRFTARSSAASACPENPPAPARPAGSPALP